MHFHAATAFTLSLVGAAAGLATSKLPASGLCPNGQYWDTIKGCTSLPPPAKCQSNQDYDSFKGCVAGQPPFGPPGLLCTIVKTLIAVTSQSREANEFCSSYLKVPKVTSTTTKTSYTTTVTSSTTLTSGTLTTTDFTSMVPTTVTTTITEDTTTTKKETSTSVVSAVSTMTISVCPPPVFLRKRDEEHREEPRGVLAKPGALANYADSAAISYACNCLSVQTSTVTSTTTLNTRTNTASTTVASVTERSTKIETTTTVVTSTITSTATTSETVVERSTTYTSTVTAVAPTFSILYYRNILPRGNPLIDFATPGAISVNGAVGGKPILQFTLGTDGALTVINGAGAGNGATTNPLAHGSASIVNFVPLTADLRAMTCRVAQQADGSCPLTCQGSHGSISYDCGSTWRVGGQEDVGSCSTAYLYAVGT
ncbi:hypothetical protein ACHAPT_001335 [Fusarium lateritium]